MQVTGDVSTAPAAATVRSAAPRTQMLQGLVIAVVGNFNPPGSGTFYQAEVLSEKFELEGASVLRITHEQNRYLRPFAIVRQLIRDRYRYHVICCQAFSFGNWTNAALTLGAAKLLRKRIVIVYRGGGFKRFVARWGWCVIPVLRFTDRLVVPSGFLRDAFEEYGLRASVIPNIIELDEWEHRARPRPHPSLLWVRHLRAGYNPWMAIEVLLQVQRRFPNATLRMAGDGGLESEIRDYLSKNNISGVRLLGHLPANELRRHYSECDIFINTTNADNQPRSVLEAMASGLPVVSTNVGGIPYLIDHGRTGWLVPPNDVDAMSAAVFTLLEQPALACQLADTAHEFVRSFSWTESRLKWFEVFEQLAKGGMSGSRSPAVTWGRS
jgi:glycosyltransferase involved in cell wall biosynthesis